MPTKEPVSLDTWGIIPALLALLVVLTAADAFAAAPYPSKPVRLIVPYPPGGSTDIIGRLIAAKLSDHLGKQVVVDNRGGASSIIGTEMVAKADPDGHTLLITTAVYTILPALQTLPYDPIKSFTPIARVGSGPNALVVHPGVPANSVRELIALAKQKPGKLVFGTPGMVGISHMSTELLMRLSGIDLKIVHFKGAGPAMIDLIGGHSQGSIASLQAALPHIKSGKLRVLGMGGLKRCDILPDVPTIAEAGVPGYEALVWWGILAPAGTPAAIVERLTKELKSILASDELKKQYLNEGAEGDFLGPAEFGQFLETDMAKWFRIVKEANIKVEK